MSRYLIRKLKSISYLLERKEGSLGSVRNGKTTGHEKWYF